MALLTAVFVTSLLGSLHCAGMCGPFVAFAVSGNSRLAPQRAALLAPQAAYHLGRLVVYAALGAIFGLLGSALNLGGAMAGFQHAAALLAGGTLVIVGLVTCLRQFAIRIPPLPVPRRLQSALAAGHMMAAGMRPTPRSALIGSLSALLPCGWLYGFVIAAAGTADPATGALLMMAFWAGTLPVLASLGLTVQCAGRLLGRRLQLATAVAIVAVGVVTVWVRIGALDAIQASAAVRPASTQDLTAEVATMDSSHAACCKGGE